MSEAQSTSDGSFRPNAKYVGRISFLLVVILGSAVAIGIGYGFDDPGFYSRIARLTWPVAGATAAFSLVRFGRLQVSGKAVTIDREHLSIRFEPLRPVDRVIERSGVARIKKQSTPSGDAVVLTLHDGREVGIPDRFLADPQLLADYLRDTWHDIPWG